MKMAERPEQEYIPTEDLENSNIMVTKCYCSFNKWIETKKGPTGKGAHAGSFPRRESVPPEGLWQYIECVQMFISSDPLI